MEESKDPYKYEHITKEYIEDILNDIVEKDIEKDRNFKFHVFFNNQEQADDWMKMFNNLCQEELIKQSKNLNNE